MCYLKRKHFTLPILTMVLFILFCIACNRAPISEFTAEPTEGMAPLIVHFDGSSSYDEDGSITKYVWDFGDGSGAQTATTAHTYELKGDYTVTLAVTDNNNIETTSSQQIHVFTQYPELISAYPFYLFIPPGAYASNEQITLVATSENNIDYAEISPSSLIYDKANTPILYYINSSVTEDIGTIVYMDDESLNYVVPSVRFPGCGCMAFIPHNSKYKYVNKTLSSRVDVSGEEINVWEFDVEVCNTGICDYTNFRRATDYYIDNIGYESEGWIFGVTARFCKFQPAYATITAGSKPNTKKVTIEDHSPDFTQTIYIPEESDFLTIKNCSSTEKNYLKDWVLDHEMMHAQINLEWENGNYGSTVTEGLTVDNMETGDLSDLEIMEFAYLMWCRIKVSPRVNTYQDEFDNSSSGKINYSNLTCKCILGTTGPDPDSPEINCIDCSKDTYCPCNDPANGKPRNYETEIECATYCPSGLKCFSVLCTSPPVCDEVR